ncbi:MAG: hypothetical protein AAF556_06555 [Pseudomonadota bacterium]
MSFRCFPLLALTVGLSLATASHGAAAPAMQHETCAIIGMVQEVSIRTEDRDKEWASSWGIADSIDYVDVTMAVRTSMEQGTGGFNNCPDKLGTHTFQLREGTADAFRSKFGGKCLEAMSRFGGDEFSIGDYLFDITEVDAAVCEASD